MKRFFCFCAVFLFFLFYTASGALAQVPPTNANKAVPVVISPDGPTTAYSTKDTKQLLVDYDRDEKGNPISPIINGRVQFVQIAFQGIVVNNKDDLYYCLFNNEKDCADGDNRYKLSDLPKDSYSYDEQSGTVIMTVCGAGKDKLKPWASLKNLKDPRMAYLVKDAICYDQDHIKDYFHEGHFYTVRLYSSKKGPSLIDSISFYVRHSFPQFSPTTGITSDNSFNAPTKLTLTFDNTDEKSIRAGGIRQNNYQLMLVKVGGGYTNTVCGILNSDKNQKSPPTVGFTFSTDMYLYTPTFRKIDGGNKPLGIGRYVLLVREQIDDDSAGRCNGGFTYYKQLITIGKTGGNTQKLEKDPSNEEAQGMLENAPPALPCNLDPKVANNGLDDNGNCRTVSTAIGPIDVDPQKFIASLFQLVLSIAGFAAIIIILIASYNIMFSGGNKEKLAAARDTITAVVLGLLFIIFSIVILKIIGVDILRIPGFK